MKLDRLSARARWRALAALPALLALLALAGLAAWLSVHGARAADPEPAAARRADAPVAVTTAAVKVQDVPVYRTGIGTVTAAQSVTVRARVDGQLDEVDFDEGADVKAGQRLARIDPRALQAQVLQARAQKARDAAQLANARVDLQRLATLIAQDAATPQQRDTQKALVAQLEATVQGDEASLRLAEVQLGYTDIVAPIAGRTGARLVDRGNIVHAADAAGLVVINQIDPITVVFTLPEDAVPAVEQALEQGSPLAVEAYPREGGERLASGRLVLLNNQIDTTSGTVQLKARFANARHRLWPGQFVTVRLVLGTRRAALTVPAAAIQHGVDGLYVYVVQPDGRTVRTEAVEVGQSQEGLAVLTRGVAAGQRVVVDGQYKLKPGAAIVEAARASAVPASAALAQAGATR